MDSPRSDTSRACGVGDYTYQISRYLEALSVETRVFDRTVWDRRGLRGLLKELKRFGADILHVQYPTIGYFRAFTAPLIEVLSPAPHVVLTSHEFVHAHPVRKFCVGFMSRHADASIFPSGFEQRAFLSKYPGLEAACFVIPIASNIEPIEHPSFDGRDPDCVLYFGQIRPQKGIEDFIQLAEIACSNNKKYKFRLVGTPHPNHRSYFNTLMERIESLPIMCDIGCPPEKVQEIFRGCTYAYLPFPDGASERRGSLLAVLSSGLATVTTLGAQTPEELKRGVTFAGSPSEALKELDSLSSQPDERDRKSAHGLQFAAGFSWEKIASQHLSLYGKILRPGSASKVNPAR